MARRGTDKMLCQCQTDTAEDGRLGTSDISL